MENLKTLKLQLKENRKKGFEIRCKIEEWQTKKVLPKFKKKYEGKFWKYKNAGSDSKKWWLYSYCIEAQSEKGGLFNSFEITPYEAKFNLKEDQFFHLCQVEITHKEYFKALDKFKEKMGELAITNNIKEKLK